MLGPAIVAFLTAVVGAWLYLRFAAGQVLDTPNQRSSHTRPTPRGGGVAIVAGFLIGLALWLANGGSLSPRPPGWLPPAVPGPRVSLGRHPRPPPPPPPPGAPPPRAAVLP